MSHLHNVVSGAVACDDALSLRAATEARHIPAQSVRLVVCPWVAMRDGRAIAAVDANTMSVVWIDREIQLDGAPACKVRPFPHSFAAAILLADEARFIDRDCGADCEADGAKQKGEPGSRTPST